MTAIARLEGAETFAAAAGAQSLGVMGVAIAYRGWDVVGPSIATQHAATTGLLAASMEHRLRLLAPVAAAVGAIASLLPGSHPGLAASIAATTTLLALSPAWWFVGTDAPIGIIRYDTTPRFLSAIVSAALLHGGASPLIYPGLMAAALGSSYGVLYLQDKRRTESGASPNYLREKKRAGSASSISIAGATYSSLSLPISQFATGDSAVEFAAGMRILALTNLATTAAIQARQAMGLLARPKIGIILLCTQGLFVAALFVAFGPLVARTLFAVDVPTSLILILAVTHVAVCLNSAIAYLYMVPAGFESALRTGTLVAALIGPLAIFLLARATGNPGAAIGTLLAELAALTTFLMLIRRSRPI